MHLLTSLCVRHPRVTVAVLLALVALVARPILGTGLALGLDATLGPDHPEVRRFEKFLERFGGGYPVLIAYECGAARSCRTALDPAALAMAYDVSRRLEQSRFVARVSSPATSSLLVASDDLGIDARRLVVDGRPSLDPTLREAALTDRLWLRALVSADGRVGAIAVELVSSESAALFAVAEEVADALAPHERAGFRFHQVGEPALWVAVHEGSVESMVRVAIGTGGTLFLTLLLLLRSLPAVAASLATVGVAAELTLGALPLLDWDRSQLTEGAATVILVIGCAGCVHFAAHYLESRSGFGDDASALVATSRWIAAPCFLTAATTVASFAALAGGGLFSLHRFGALAAIGVSLAFLLTFSLLPALFTLVPPKPRSPRHSLAWRAVLERVSRVGLRHAPVVLAAATALAVAGLTGTPKLRLDLGITALWDAEHPVTRALEFVAEHLQRPTRVEIEVALPADASLQEPGVLARLDEAQRALERIEGIEGSRSIATLLLHADRLLRPGPANGVDAFDSEGAVGELLTLISAGDPGALDPWMTLDQTRLRISAETPRLSTTALDRLAAEAERSLRRNLPAGWGYSVTGPAALAGILGREFSRSQTAVLSAASVAVFVLIAAYLRSLPWALLALIPNAVALVVLFGAMGHLGIAVDFGAAIVGPIAIGIAADDSIHFLTAYARGRRAGRDWAQAIRGAIAGAGEAVITTSAALALGFLSMLASPFATISNLGLLSAIAILAATLADLLVLPALIAAAAATRSRFAAPRQPAPGTEPPPPTRSDVF